ncbi:MAG: hypothetical protein GXP53_02395 [Deltaproteobacteria bacterium]|nr:hypothetical protein [Deltaproteobacteria bacterium]
MKFSILLFVLGQVLKFSSFTNGAFKKFTGKISTKILIKTEDGVNARLFVFDKGKFSTIAGDTINFDAALVWKDADTAFSVMTSKSPDASFNAAADGKLKVLGMSVYAQWFEDAVKLVM